MCHVSVGHVQRVVEAAGIPAVGVYISAFGHVPQQLSVSRALITPNPLGRPLGAPGDAERQLDVVEAALALFGVDSPTIRDYPHAYRPSPSGP